MEINKINVVYFSPCGNVEKAVMTMAVKMKECLGVDLEVLDYTLPKAREAQIGFSEGDLVIFGSPVYAGRIPNKTLPYIQQHFTGNGALAIPVVLYGNRSYGDALVELRNELEEHGFHTVAGAAITSQHSFAETLASGRPDEEDLKAISDFAKDTAEKIKSMEEVPAPVFVKGNNPPEGYYVPKGLDGKPAAFLKAKPKTDLDKCDNCKICAGVCPMGSISFEDPAQVTGICIKCHACVNKCPKDAKYFDDEAFLSHQAMLKRDYTRRVENEFFK